MSRVYSLIAVLLVTLWFPATQLCALNAAGLIPAPPLQDGSKCACPPGDPCRKDNCQDVEQNLAEPTSNDLVIGAPQDVLLDFHIWLQALERLTPSGESEGSVSPDRSDAWFALVRTWQFERRAALEPRLPSLA
ncbi:MAG: hypothetical protein WC661_01930 [Opitutaceae bacterium]|jgi:hypothetical protein